MPKHRLPILNDMKVFFAAGLLAVLAMGCATSPPLDPSAGLPELPVALSLLVTGDTGRRPSMTRHLQKQISVARGMESEDRRQPADALLLLGDNFYWKGLERHEVDQRIRVNLVRPYCRFVSLDGPRSAEVRSACDRSQHSRPPVPIYALLGDHDYDSPESPTLERGVIPEFIPNWHMPAGLVEVIEVGAGVSLVMLDSIALAAGADVAPLVRALASSQGPWRILAVHEPVGLARLGGSGLMAQRRHHRETVLSAIRAAGVTVQLVLSGEEHNLQIIEMAEPEVVLQVVAGSGARVRELRTDNPDARFTRAQLGFARVDLLGTGARQELVVSIFTTGTFPLFDRGAPELAARWAISSRGAARDLLDAALPDAASAERQP